MTWKSWIPLHGDRSVRKKLRELDEAGIGIPMIIILFLQKSLELLLKGIGQDIPIPSYSDNYPYSSYDRGVLTVVDDLAEADFVYAEDIGYESEERFEVRRKGLSLGRFESLDDARLFLDGQEL